MAMDFLAGAGPPAAPPGGPDLAAALGGGGGGADEEPLSEVEALDAILMACHDYAAIPTVEESERLEIEKVTTIVQQLKAKNEKMSDSITGANPAMRKALGAS